MSEEAIQNEGAGRQFEVGLLRCTITEEFGKCIRVKLGQFANEAGEIAEVFGQFSKPALEMLLADLESAADPVLVPSRQAVQEATPYQWALVMRDGRQFQQFPIDGFEMPFATIDCEQVAEFWLVPKDAPDSHPWYGLTREDGFLRLVYGQEPEKLDLPFPGEAAWHYSYFRRVACTSSNRDGQQEHLPPHVRQVLGWSLPHEVQEFVTSDNGETRLRTQRRVTLCEIAVEDDGQFQVYRRETRDEGELPPPGQAPAPDAAAEDTPYQWAVIRQDGEQVQQFPEAGGETPLAAIDLDQVRELWVVPKHDGMALPWYCLSREQGFLQSGEDAEPQRLPLPAPEAPFVFRYGRPEAPSRHVIGWQVEQRLFEIAIGSDGAYAVYQDGVLQEDGAVL